VSLTVVVAAEWCEFVGPGVTGLRIWFAVIEITVGCGHPASGGDTGPVSGMDVALLAGFGSSSGGSVVDDHSGVGVGDGVPPFGLLLVFGDLAGDVGDDWSVSGEVSGVVVEFGEGGEVNADVDGAFLGPVGVPTSAEEVEGYVGAELVEGSGFVGCFEV
jgi:hypothetical protein